MRRVLIIKLGALGDVVLSLAAVERIRFAHPEAEITVLTTPAFAPVFGPCPWVDRVEDDGRPQGFAATAAMLGRVRRARYDRVYDLQTSSRSSAYFQALRPHPPEWSGVAAGCSHPHRNPDRDQMHTLERQAGQLQDAGIWPDAPTAPGSAPPPDLGWLTVQPPATELPQPYALLIPGGSAHRPEKRWPAAGYADVAERLAGQGMAPVVVGGPAEAELAREIAGRVRGVVDLTGRTDVAELARLAARAHVAIGNDTGPTHVAAAAGAPTLALFSAASDPALTAPRGRRVEVLRTSDLENLPVDTVWSLARGLITDA